MSDIGIKIFYLRRCKHLTQQQLGELIGFSKASARIRISEYEKSARVPNKEILNKMAEVLTVHPLYLATPAEYYTNELMHILFALEGAGHIQLERIHGEPYLKFISTLHDKKTILKWFEMHDKFNNGDISIDEYAWWKYRYPKKPEDFKDASSKDTFDFKAFIKDD